MTIEEIARSEGIWGTREQNGQDIVLKSSLQFYRNVRGYPFAHRLSKRDKDQVSKLLVDCIMVNEIFPDVWVCNVEDLSPVDRKILHERNILKDERMSSGNLALDPNQSGYFILGDVDHMNFVAERSGFCFDELHSFAKSALHRIEKKVDFSFSQRIGYLTANPRNAGPAFSACLYIHLPGLVLSEKINEVATELDKKGFMVRSSWLEGYYEVANKSSLGTTESDLFEAATSSFSTLIQMEREIREAEYRANRIVIEDKIWRSFGTLTVSRLISLYESMEHLSALRLGVSLGILNGVSLKDINLLLYFVQDFHLKKRYGVKDTGRNMDEVRAVFLRDYFKEVS